MPSLKEYRNRIVSVKSTRKITSAMKMVAASKLKRAQGAAEQAQPYAQALNGMLRRVAQGITLSPSLPKLLVGTGAEQTQLLIVMTADRGLCGGFNGNLVRFAKQQIRDLQAQGKTVKLLTVGRRARDLLRRDFPELIVKSFVDFGKSKTGIAYENADEVAQYLLAEYAAGAFDVATLVYNEFRNVLVQKPTARQLVPFKLSDVQAANENKPVVAVAPYDFEPEEEALLAALLPKNLSTQLFGALLDSAAGEQAARMTAMDNATRNAGDMIKKLSLAYNRARQAYITKELIEIISGAEAV